MIWGSGMYRVHQSMSIIEEEKLLSNKHNLLFSKLQLMTGIGTYPPQCNLILLPYHVSSTTSLKGVKKHKKLVNLMNLFKERRNYCSIS